jgi:1,4-alpha-glucan branching enzyme
LPKEAAKPVETVHTVGGFNNWDYYATPMKKLKSGAFTATFERDPGREYQFRYLMDETKWENDWQVEKYVPTPYGNAENSVVVV